MPHGMRLTKRADQPDESHGRGFPDGLIPSGRSRTSRHPNHKPAGLPCLPLLKTSSPCWTGWASNTAQSSTRRCSPSRRAAPGTKIPGLHCKNLFIKDRKGGIWLVVMPADKRADLGRLEKLLAAPRFSFARPELLQEVLELTPG